MNRERINQLARGPAWILLGMTVRDVFEDEVMLTLPLRSELLQVYGNLHGGFLSTLLDAAMSAAVHGRLADSQWAATTHMDVSFLRPAQGTMISAHGRIVKLGSRLVHCQAEACDDAGRLVAQASAQFYVGQQKTHKD